LSSVEPWPDGNDAWLEWLFVLSVALGVGGVLVFTGLDAQVEYAVTQTGDYFDLSSADSENVDIDRVLLEESDIQGLEFSTSNRIGADAVGGEIGICGGIRGDGSVFDLRVAEDVNEMTFESVQFSCVPPYNLIMHSQPGSDMLSDEDKDFDGEIRPDVTCIISSELSVSITDRVLGISCWDAPSVSGGEFVEIPVYLRK